MKIQVQALAIGDTVRIAGRDYQITELERTLYSTHFFAENTHPRIHGLDVRVPNTDQIEIVRL